MAMEDTRHHKKVEGELEGERRREFTRAVLKDLRALERMLAEGWFETDVRRIGAEQEMFLVDGSWHPTPGALKVLELAQDPHFTTELAQFNLEANCDPQVYTGDGLSRMEAQLEGLLDRARQVVRDLDMHVVLMGILPTIRKTDLGLENMVPSPRYAALNRAMTAMRGTAYEFSIKGIDELLIKHDSVMVEACNCSFQVHLQVTPDEFARMYNLAQVLAGPILSVATNSAILFGRRLWAETRIALFQQAVDTRASTHHLREALSRVNFGKRWVKKSVTEIFKEDILRFRTLVGTDLDEDPIVQLDRGVAPQLKALRLHNGTVYRWNRACYGVINGKPHLRIENRVMPSGPTVIDEMANSALWLGLMTAMSRRYEDITRHIEFDHAQANLWSAARDGLGAHFRWLDGEEVRAQQLVLDRLLPWAEEGLASVGIDEADRRRYLGVVEERARTMRDGSRWQLASLDAMKDRGTPGERLNALVAATVQRQASGRPVAQWERARLDEADNSKYNFLRVDQYMRTDFFTVQPDDAVELVADLMSWERIRHVPVEDGSGRLVGLVSYRAVLRYYAEQYQQQQHAQARASGELALAALGEEPGQLLPLKPASASVADIMRRDVITVTPDTPTLEAIAIMRRYRIGCLPVVHAGQLVAVVTEEDFMNIASHLLEQKLQG
ncbi:MAG TPA: glutamate-cysteine ligase family protein [Polyangia bacterium]|jgi:CBS domain-containing protein/gamma-glutamyl:cysteine ligase YbdK (ATP-grasp superfamily)|nr:glutamate-cysteine ligase family protein [Polyangia bacterium]